MFSFKRFLEAELRFGFQPGHGESHFLPGHRRHHHQAAVLDLYTRRIVGWAMSDRMTSDLTAGARR